MVRMACAPVAAPKPAVLGVSRAGLIEPSASVCELTIVAAVYRSSRADDSKKAYL